MENGHFKHQSITENLKCVGFATFLSLFIAVLIGGAVYALTCWLTPTVIVVGEGHSHKECHLFGKIKDNFLDKNSLYLQNETDETLFLVGVYYSSGFSYSSKEDIIKTIPPKSLIAIENEPYKYFDTPPRIISYRTRRYSPSTSGILEWFILDLQLFNQYRE